MDQGIAILVGAFISAIISGIVAWLVSKTNLKAVERTASATIEGQSKILMRDLERTGQEIKAKIGVEVLSKNRQEWINELRTKISEYYVIAINLPIDLVKASNKSRESDSITNEKIAHKITDVYMEKSIQLQKLQIYISLMLNPNEQIHQNVIKTTEEILANLNHIYNLYIPNDYKDDNYKCMTDEEIEKDHDLIADNVMGKLIPFLLENTKSILKEEWERVKKGV